MYYIIIIYILIYTYTVKNKHSFYCTSSLMNSISASYFKLRVLASTLITTEVHALILPVGKRFFSSMMALINELFPAPVLPKTPTSSLLLISKSLILFLWNKSLNVS